MTLADLDFDTARLAALCRRHGVARLELIGSFARGDADENSDVDILVTFERDTPDGFELVELRQELTALLGRPVDILTRRSVERSPNKYFRRFALSRAEPLYDRA